MPLPQMSAVKTRTARRSLEVNEKPYWHMISPGIGLGYRRTANAAGRWYVRNTHGKQWMKRIGFADDAEAANGSTVLSYEQAQDRARAMGRHGKDAPSIDDARPRTLAEAIDAYEQHLIMQGCDRYNATRARYHLTPVLLATPVGLLTADMLLRWRDSLAGTLKSASINRTIKCVAAACELALKRDPRISTNRAWKTGLEKVGGRANARNVILDDETIRRFVATAYERDQEFGLMIETAAVTGARMSQIARIEVGDLQTDRTPRILMPRSGKGGGRDRAAKKEQRIAVPITPSLAAMLRTAAKGRKATEPLLMRRGYTLQRERYRHAIRRLVASIGLDPEEVTLYALRHSAIVRELMANVPIRIVAATHDTSVGQIESNYSRFIADHSDALSRAALLNMQPNVVAMTKGA